MGRLTRLAVRAVVVAHAKLAVDDEDGSSKAFLSGDAELVEAGTRSTNQPGSHTDTLFV